MTNKEQRKKEAEVYRSMRNEVLLGDDPEIWVVRCGDEMSLGIAMEDIHDYISASLNMDANPLRHLRNQFPGFIWEFHQDLTKGKLKSVLAGADYIWAPGVTSDEEFVVARQIGRENHRVLLFLSRVNEHSGWNSWMKREVRGSVPNIRFVMNGDDMNSGTVIRD